MPFLPEEEAVLKALAQGVLAAQRAAGAAPRSGDAPRPRNGSSTGGVMRFGRAKGTRFEDAEGADLAWYSEALQKSIENPSKSEYRAGNERDLAAIRAVQAKRAGGGERDDGLVPYDTVKSGGGEQTSFHEERPGMSDDEIPFCRADDLAPRHERRRARWERW